MSDWDDDSPQLGANIARIVTYAFEDARHRSKPGLDDALKWHRDLMDGLEIPPVPGLDIPVENFVGRFRGTSGLANVQVGVGRHRGVRADLVPSQLQAFQQELQRKVALLDAQIGPDLTEQDLTASQIIEVLRLCAWAHAEWVRIHPFANGNGRTARIWANVLALRYALPPFVRLRPRPGPDYEAAGAAAMRGHWENTVPIFLRMYEAYDA